MGSNQQHESSAKRETGSVTGVRVGGYVLEVGADCRSYTRFAARPESENAAALAKAFTEAGERDDLSAPVAALEELDESAAAVTDRIEHAQALFQDVLTGRFDRGFVMREIDGLLGLSERLDRSGRYEEQLRLARALHGLLATMFRWLDLIRTLRRALRSAKVVNDQAGHAWALHELGTLHLSAGDAKRAERLFREALRIERRLEAVGSCATRHSLDCARRDRFGRRFPVAKVIAALAVGAMVVAVAGIAAGVAFSRDQAAPQLRLVPDTLSFGALAVGETSPPKRLSVRAGYEVLRLGRVVVDHADEFLVESGCPARLAPGQICAIDVRFRPARVGTRTAELRISVGEAQELGAELTGSGMTIVAASLTPDAVDFGEAEVGTRTEARTVSLSAGSMPLHVHSIASDSREFSVEEECPGTLDAGESCEIDVSFTPASAEATAATLTVANEAGAVLTSTLHGTGIPSEPNPGTLPVLDDFLDLGEVDVYDRSSPGALTLTAGSKPLTVVGTESDSREFQVAERCLGLLEAHESCAVEVVFGPTAEGIRRATLEVTLANGRVMAGELRGTGGPPVGPPVDGPTLEPSVDLGEARVRTRLPARSVVLTAGSEALADVEVTSDSPEFVVSDHCPPSLAARASCPIHVVFAPADTGLSTATLTVTADGRRPLTSALRGIGVLVDPPKLDRFLELGDVEVGLRSPAGTLTLTAGSEPLTIRGIASDSAEFHVKEHCRQTLAPRERCEIGAVFAPALAEARTATLTVRREGGRPLTSALHGTGFPETLPRLDGSVELGEVEVGSRSEARKLTLTAGSRRLTILEVSSDPPREFHVTDDCPEALAAAASCSIEVVFEPAAGGSRTATLEVVLAGREPLRSQVTGTGVVPPMIRPSTVDFGQVVVDTREPATIRLTAGSKPLTVKDTQTDDSRQFIVSNACEGRLDPGASCDITVLFLPLAAGGHSARLSVAVSDGPALEVRLTGVGIEGFIALSPEKLDFGSFSAISRTLVVTLTNTGPAPLTIRSITSSNSYFSVKSGCPAVLAAGRSCNFWVTLTPPDFGQYSAWITIAANGGGQHKLFATGNSIQSPIG